MTGLCKLQNERKICPFDKKNHVGIDHTRDRSEKYVEIGKCVLEDRIAQTLYYEDYKRQEYLVSRDTELYRFFTSIHCEQRKMCATNKQFYIGASSLFSAIDTSLLDRFNSRILSSRLNPISYITHLLQTKTINSFTNSSFASTAP